MYLRAAQMAPIKHGGTVSQPTRVLFVCLGNICRSPMAEGLMLHLVQQRGLADQFRIESAGTAAYHQGERPDRRSMAVLQKHGISLNSLARQVRADDFEDFDWILAMDASNLRDLEQRCPPHRLDRVHLCLEPVGGDDVPDPYYGGPNGFDANYAMLDEALQLWLDRWLADVE